MFFARNPDADVAVIAGLMSNILLGSFGSLPAGVFGDWATAFGALVQ